MAGLDVLQQGQPPQQQMLTPPQLGGGSLTDQLLQGMIGRITNFPSTLSQFQGQQNAALANYQNAVRTAGRETQGPMDAMLTGMLTAPNPADAKGVFANSMQSVEANRLKRLQEEKEREIAATQAGLNVAEKQTGEQINALAHMGAMGGVLGLARSSMVNDRVLMQNADQIYKAKWNEYIKLGDPQAEQKARAETYDWLRSMGYDPQTLAGRNAFGMRTPELPAGGQVPQQQPDTVIPPGSTGEQTLTKLAQLRDFYKQTGQTEKAQLAQDQINDVQRDMRNGKATDSTPVFAPNGQPAAPLGGFDLGALKNKEKGVSQAKEEGTLFAKYEQGLGDEAAEQTTMLRNIQHMEEEAKTANFGNLAAAKTQALKWAQAFGVPLTAEEQSSMSANQVLGKIGLQLATIGAKNISSRPTQMEFQKLLEGGIPATGMTRDAFLRVLALFKEAPTIAQQKLQDFQTWKKGIPGGATTPADYENYWTLKQNSPNFRFNQNINMQNILDTMKARGWTYDQTLEKLRGVK